MSSTSPWKKDGEDTNRADGSGRCKGEGARSAIRIGVGIREGWLHSDWQCWLRSDGLGGAWWSLLLHHFFLPGKVERNNETRELQSALFVEFISLSGIEGHHGIKCL